jgi:hypothetical protein
MEISHVRYFGEYRVVAACWPWCGPWAWWWCSPIPRWTAVWPPQTSRRSSGSRCDQHRRARTRRSRGERWRQVENGRWTVVAAWHAVGGWHYRWTLFSIVEGLEARGWDESMHCLFVALIFWSTTRADSWSPMRWGLEVWGPRVVVGVAVDWVGADDMRWCGCPWFETIP